MFANHFRDPVYHINNDHAVSKEEMCSTTTVPVLLTMILDQSSVVIKFQYFLLLTINTKSVKITKVDNGNKIHYFTMIKTIIYTTKILKYF